MKLFLSPLLALGILPLSAQQVDTLATVHEAHQVLVTQSNKAISVNIQGAGRDSSYHFHYTVPTGDNASLVETRAIAWDFSLLGIKSSERKREVARSLALPASLRIGFNSGKDIMAGGSWDIDLDILSFNYQFRQHRLLLTWGYGWGKYVFADGKYLDFDGAYAQFGAYPTGVLPGRSVFRLNRHAFSLSYRYQVPDTKLKFTAGIQLNKHVRPRIYNTYYLTTGERQRETYKTNVHFTPVTLSYRMQVDWHNIGVYAKWSPGRVFQKGFGPELSTFSLGVSLFAH